MTPPTCSCGTQYKRRFTGQAHCPDCIEKTRPKPPQEPETPSATALRLYRAAHAEAGWPKGIVEYRGVYAIVCDQRVIDRHAHCGTLVGVVSRSGSIEDFESMVSA